MEQHLKAYGSSQRARLLVLLGSLVLLVILVFETSWTIRIKTLSIPSTSLPRESRPAMFKLVSRADSRRISKNVPTTVNGVHRIILATVPRTGNGWLRGLLESATGVATESVFKEGVQSIFHERSPEAFGKTCGWLDNCALVRQSAGIDPVIIKTHFPFTSSLDNLGDRIADGMADTGPASYIIAPVRNPLDNHDAWQRYQKERAPEIQTYMDLASFMHAWVIHHEFWYGLNTPMIVYRYEDLLAQPIHLLRNVLQASGLWQYYLLSDVELARVGFEQRLQTHKSKRIGASTRQKNDLAHGYTRYSVEDIKWMLDNYRWILDRFGYTELYEIWLEAASGKLVNDDEITQRVQLAMIRTASQANWGDTYSFDFNYFNIRTPL
eukprot:gene4252-6578_t